MPDVDLLRPSKVGELDESDALQGLTSQQFHFALYSFMGDNDAAAYRKAYGYPDSTPDNDPNLAYRAHVVANNPKVQAKLFQLRAKHEATASLAPLLSKQFVLNGVMQLALSADKDSTRLRAYELLGKTVGIDLFRETHRVEKTERTVEQIDAELKERLKNLMPLIEGKATDVTPKAGASSTPPPGQSRKRKPRPVPGQ